MTTFEALQEKISVRATNNLKALGIVSTYDLLEHTEAELLQKLRKLPAPLWVDGTRMRRTPKMVVSQVRDALASFGLSLRKDEHQAKPKGFEAMVKTIGKLPTTVLASAGPLQASGRPPCTLRLRDIDPHLLAVSVTHAVGTYAEKMASFAGCRLSPAERTEDLALPAPLYTHVLSLADYAVGTTNICDVELHLTVIKQTVWGTADKASVQLRPVNLDKLVRGNWVDELQLVLVAARARFRLHSSEDLTVADLAALGGCSPNHVRLMRRQGKIKFDVDGLDRAKSRNAKWTGVLLVVSAAEAKRWLAGGTDGSVPT